MQSTTTTTTMTPSALSLMAPEQQALMHQLIAQNEALAAENSRLARKAEAAEAISALYQETIADNRDLQQLLVESRQTNAVQIERLDGALSARDEEIALLKAELVALKRQQQEKDSVDAGELKSSKTKVSSLEARIRALEEKLRVFEGIVNATKEATQNVQNWNAQGGAIGMSFLAFQSSHNKLMALQAQVLLAEQDGLTALRNLQTK